MSFERKIPIKPNPFLSLPRSDIGSLKRSIYPCKISTNKLRLHYNNLAMDQSYNFTNTTIVAIASTPQLLLFFTIYS